MRKKLLSLLMVLFMALSASAVTTVAAVDFESGIPAGWTQDSTLSVNHQAWLTGSAVVPAPTGATGSYAYLLNPQYATRSKQFVTRLITPVLNCGGIFQPRLIFTHAQPAAQSGEFDQLKIYYRTAADGEWQTLVDYTTAINVWQTDTLLLISPNNAYQLAFEGNVNEGVGIYLDNLTIASTPQCPEINAINVTARSNAADVNIGGATTADAFRVFVSTTRINSWSEYDPATSVYYNASVADWDFVVTGLAPQTDYYLHVSAECADDPTGYAPMFVVPFRTSLGFPMTENFANGIPADWSLYSTKLDTAYAGGQFVTTTSSNNWSIVSNIGLNGDHAVAYSSSSYNPYWMMTPTIDLASVAQGSAIDLRFDLALTNSKTSSSAVTESTKKNLTFYVLISEDGVNWTRANTYTWSNSPSADYDIKDVPTTGHRYRINMNKYIGRVIRMAFVTGNTASGYFHVGNIAIDNYDPQCGDASKLTTSVTVNSITANWNILGKQNAIIELFSDAAYTDLIDSTYITTGTSYTYSGLTQATNYYLRLRQDCQDAEWVKASCRTAVGIPYTNVFSGTSAPEGWTRYTGVTGDNVMAGTAVLPAAVNSGWNFKNAPTYFSGMTGGCAYVDIYGTSKNWLVSPDVYLNANAGESVRVTFRHALSKSSTSATAPKFTDTDDVFQVMVSTDGGMTWLPANARSWRADGTGDMDLTGMTQFPQRFSMDVTQFVGQSIKVALYGGSITSGSDNYLYVSDFAIETYDPTCGGLTNLNLVQDGQGGATVSWMYTGIQSADVILSTSATFADTIVHQTVTTNSYTFTNLAGNTQYYVRVRQNCTDADWMTTAFRTPCGVMTVFPWSENFESHNTGDFAQDCWENVHIAGTSSYVFSVATGTGSNNSKVLQLKDQQAGNRTMLVLPQMDFSQAANGFEFAIDVYRSNSTYSSTYAQEGLSIYCSTVDHLDSIHETKFAFIPREYSVANAYVPAAPNNTWNTYRLNIPLRTVGYIIIVGESQYCTATNFDNLLIEAAPTCTRMTGVNVTSITGNGATIKHPTTNAQSYQVVIANASINPDSLENYTNAIVYNELLTGDQHQVSGAQFESNTLYYVYVRGFCGGTDYSVWSTEVTFRTLCAAITPADFGTEDFQNVGNFECWTTGFMVVPDTLLSQNSAYARRNTSSSLGAYLQLSKEAVNSTSYHYKDGAYAITPELELGTDSITKYQVTFSAGTNSTAATNVKRVSVGVVTTPSDLDTYTPIKIINLTNANDSNSLSTYVVSFADYEGDYNEDYGRYVMFLSEAGEDSTNYVVIDNVSFELADGCQQLIELSADSISTSAARMRWEDEEAMSYDVFVTPYGGKADTIAATSKVFTTTVMTNEAIITGLNASSRYYAYVRANCDAQSTSKWSSALVINTAIGIPYVDSLRTLDNWTKYSGKVTDMFAGNPPATTTSGWNCATAQSVAGIEGVHPYYNLYSTNANYLLMSKPIDLTGQVGHDIALTIQMGITPYSSGTPNVTNQQFWVLVSTDNGATWNRNNAFQVSKASDADYDIDNSINYAYEYTFYLSKFAGQSITLALAGNQYTTGGDNYIHIANLKLDTIAAIPFLGVTGAKFTNVGQTSVDMTFVTKATDVATYEYMVGENGFDTTGVASVVTTDTTVTISGLNSSSKYDVYVRATSLTGQVCEWVGPIQFKTALGLPFVDPLTNLDNWTKYSAKATDLFTGTAPTGTTSGWSCSASKTVNGISGVHPYYNLYGTGTNYMLMSEPIMLNGQAGDNVELKVKMGITPYSGTAAPTVTNQMFWVLVSTDNGATWNRNNAFLVSKDTAADYDIELSSNTAYEYTFSLTPFIGQAVTIGLVGNQYVSGGDNYIHIADFSMRKIVAGCDDPDSLQVTAVTTTTANLTWQGNAAHQTVVELSKVADFASVARRDTVANGLAYTMQNLEHSTQYYVRVKQICSADDQTAYSPIVGFITECAPIAELPYVMDFEGYNANDKVMPICWTRHEYVSGTTTYPHVYGTGAYQGTGVLYFFGGAISGSGINSGQTAILPEMTAPLNTLRIQFMAKQTMSDASRGSLIVGTMTSPNDTASFMAIDTIEKASAYTVREVYLTNAPATHHYIAIRFSGGASTTYAYVDNVKVSEIPTCLDMNMVKVENITSTSATVIHTNTGATNYEVVVANQAINMNQLDSAAMSHIVMDIDTFTTDTNMINGLDPITTYYVYVRGVCSATDFGAWNESVVSFTTECAEFALPFSEDFNAITSANPLPNCWDRSNTCNSTSYNYNWGYSSSGHNSSKCLYVQNYYGYTYEEGYTATLTTPTISISEPVKASFWYKNTGAHAFTVMAKIDGAGMPTILFSNNAATNAWTEQEVDLNAYVGHDVQLFFVATVDLDYEYGSTSYVYLDDITIAGIPATETVIALETSNVTRTSVDLNWVIRPGSDVNTFEVVTSETQLTDSALNAAQKVIVNDTLAYTATNLNRGTTYYFYVRSNMNDTVGDWIMTSAKTMSLSACEDVTVADGTATSSYVPVYGLWADDELQMQMIYPASMLSELVGQSITALHFYVSSGDNSESWDNSTFLVRMGTTTANDLGSSFQASPANLVYSGNLSANVTNGMTITFSNPFTYTGGNLLLEIAQPVGSDYTTVAFMGMSQTTSTGRYSYGGASGTAASFLPKTTFTYCYQTEACPEVATVSAQLTGDGVSTAMVNWTASEGDYANTYDVFYADTMVTDFTNVVPQYDSIAATMVNLSGLNEFTDYYVYVRANCDAMGHADGSSTWNYTTFKTNSNCPVVHDLAAQLTAKDAAMVSWNLAFDEQDTAFVYILSATELDSAALATNAGTLVQALEVNFTNLTLGTTYYVYVASSCGEAHSPWLMTSFTTSDACAAVVNLHTTAVAFNAVSLAWNRAQFAEETLWEAGIVGMEQYAVTTNDSAVTLIGLNEETNYVAYVKAICSATDTSAVATVAFQSASAPQPCAMIGDAEGDNYNFPFDLYYKNGWTQSIYTAEQVGQAGEITSIWYNVTAAPSTPYTDTEMHLYLAHTTMSVAGTSDWVPEADIVEVFNAQDYAYPTDLGWFEIPLQNSFQYDGTSNLVVMCATKGTSYVNTLKLAHTVGTNGVTLYRRNDSDPTYGEYPTASGSQSTQLPDVQFCFEQEACAKPANITVSNVTGSSAKVSWMPGGSERSWNTVVSATPLTDTELATALKDTVTTLYQNITGLNADADCYFYIRSICGAGIFGSWVEVHFITVADCKSPINLRADSLSDVMAIVAWSDDNAEAALSYEVAYGVAATFNMADSTSYQTMMVTDTTAMLTGLLSNTEYNFAVRATCSATLDSRWSAVASFTTECGYNTIYPWSENFNSYNDGDFIAPCWINEHISGSGSSIFNVYSTTNGSNTTRQLRLPDMSAGTKTLLVLPGMAIDTVNGYEFRMDMYRNATGTSYTTEGIRVFMNNAPALDGNEIEMGFISRNFATADANHGIPAEAASGWYTYGFTIPMEGNVYIILRGESQYGSATFMDNFMVRELPKCGKPHDVTITTTPNSAHIEWQTNSDSTYVLAISATDTLFNGTIDTTAIDFTNLPGMTQFGILLRGVCSDGGQSDAVIEYFETAAGIPYMEDFNGATAGLGWTTATGTPAAAFNGTNPAPYSGGWSISTNSNGLPANHVRINIYSSNTDKWLISPVISAGNPGDALRLTFDFAYTNYNNGNAPDDNSDQSLWLLTSTDGGDSWSQANSIVWSHSEQAAQTYGLDQIRTTGSAISVDMSQYAGMNIQLAFVATTRSGDNDFHIGNIVLNTFNANCLDVTDLAVSNVSMNGAQVDWKYQGAIHNAVIMLSTTQALDPESAILVDTVYNDSTYTLPALMPSTKYYVAVAQLCDGDEMSAWNQFGFSSPIGVPYYPTFTSALPEGWTRSNTDASAVFAGTAMATYNGGWSVVAADAVIATAHAKINIYGTSCHYWMITPSIDLTPNVGQGLLLSFDAALCKYGNVGTAPQETGTDDIFMVAVSTDDGATWQRRYATLWQDSANADYGYSAIPVTGQRYMLDMSAYAGHVVKIGFYGESTVSGGDNDLHVGNISLTQCQATMYSGTICDGQTFNQYGFTVTPNDYEPGENAYSRYTAATETTPETLEVLALTVNPITKDTIHYTSCAGEPIAYDEHIMLDAGEVQVGEQTFIFRLTSQIGCDSVIYFVVNGMPVDRTTEQYTTCEGVPYLWHNQELYLAGTYFDTLTNVNGCDSICTLLLTVTSVFSSDTTAYMCFGDAPLVIEGVTVTESGDYVEHYQTATGCEAQRTWHVTVVPELKNAYTETICKGEVYSDEHFEGLTVSGVYNITIKSPVSGCDSTLILTLVVIDSEEPDQYFDYCVEDLPLINADGIEIIPATAEVGSDNWIDTYETECGTVTLHYTVIQCSSALDDINADGMDQVQKIIENGNLIIIKNGKRYSATGAELK